MFFVALCSVFLCLTERVESSVKEKLALPLCCGGGVPRGLSGGDEGGCSNDEETLV